MKNTAQVDAAVTELSRANDAYAYWLNKKVPANEHEAYRIQGEAGRIRIEKAKLMLTLAQTQAKLDELDKQQNAVLKELAEEYTRQDRNARMDAEVDEYLANNNGR